MTHRRQAEVNTPSLRPRRRISRSAGAWETTCADEEVRVRGGQLSVDVGHSVSVPIERLRDPRCRSEISVRGRWSRRCPRSCTPRSPTAGTTAIFRSDRTLADHTSQFRSGRSERPEKVVELGERLNLPVVEVEGPPACCIRPRLTVEHVTATEKERAEEPSGTGQQDLGRDLQRADDLTCRPIW